jgi:hypothetical protein
MEIWSHYMYKVYVPLTGNSYIGAEETAREGNAIAVRNPVMVSRATDGIGYAMHPIQFMLKPILHTTGLLMEDEMPPDMIPYYKKYVEIVEAERQHRP